MASRSGSTARGLRSIVPLLLAFVAVPFCACSSSPPNEVRVVEGAAATTTTAARSSASDLDLGERTLTDDSEVTTVGIGEIRWEMPLDEAQQAGGVALIRDEGGDDSCYLASPDGGPEGLTFLVADGAVQRVDVTTEAIRTPSGAGVGMTEQELRDLFPARLQAAPVEGGNVLTFVPDSPGEAQLRIAFATDGSTVTSYRAGRLPYVERLGC